MFADVLEKPQPVPVTTGKKHSILIVDDDETMSEVLSRRLGQQGFATATAELGRQGLRKARTAHPDLILLDLRLPDADGLAICAELADSSETCEIPVIIVSGMESPDLLRRCRAAGCRYFIRKPYDPNALLVLVRQAIDDAEAWNEPI